MKRLSAVLLACSLTVEAQAVEITLTLGGQFYEGAPEYEILVDDVVVASGIVTKEQGDTVTVEVGSPNSLAIRYINDFAAPKGPDGKRPPGTDRNLIIEAVEIGGQRFPGKELAGAKGVVRALDTIIVSTNQTVAIPMTAPAAAAFMLSRRSCNEMDVHLTGYQTSAVFPSDVALNTLNGLLTGSGCSIEITGYSSVSESDATDTAVAERRALAVRDYLGVLGISFGEVRVSALAGTQQFGNEDDANRRVTISLR